jgi:hypothetical protein
LTLHSLVTRRADTLFGAVVVVKSDYDCRTPLW